MGLMSISDIMLALKWKQYYQKQSQTFTFRNSWEQIRLLAAYTVAPHMKKKIGKLSDLFKLDWDSDATTKQLTEEEKARRAEIFAAWDAEKRNQNGR